MYFQYQKGWLLQDYRDKTDYLKISETLFFGYHDGGAISQRLNLYYTCFVGAETVSLMETILHDGLKSKIFKN